MARPRVAGDIGIRQPLRRATSTRSDDRDGSEAVVELDKAFPVAFGGRLADARVHSGGFEAAPRPSQEASSCSACSDCEAGHYLQVDGADIVGATLEGPASFRVWSAPIVSPGAKHRTRRLVRSEPRECESPAAAEAAVALLRRTHCWWGKDQPPRVAVFVNPVSGPGRSRSIWGEVRPVLEAAGLQLSVTETARQGHAREAAASLDCARLDCLACLGGDGTVSEVVQGLFERPDWADAISLPLAHIPGGTGNGLAASCGLWTPATAAHALTKGVTKRMDVVSMLQPPGRRYFSFLSLTYGLIANVDIGTESLRWMGSFRNQIGALREILRAGEYCADVAVLPSAEPRAITNGKGSADPIATPALDALGPLEDFPPLASADLPQGWRRLERSAFSLLTVSVLPWLATDFSLVPGEAVDSGEMTLTHLPGRLPQWQALRCLLKAEAGKISEAPRVGEEKIAAFVLEPTRDGTWLVMDGEVIPFERVFAELHPGICRAITAP